MSFQVLHCRELVALLNGILDFRCIILLICVPSRFHVLVTDNDISGFFHYFSG